MGMTTYAQQTTVRKAIAAYLKTGGKVTGGKIAAYVLAKTGISIARSTALRIAKELTK